MPERLTHLDPLGRARMVDVTPKEPSHRRAVARGRVHMQPETTALVARGSVGKGDVLNVSSLGFVGMFVRLEDELDVELPDDLFNGRTFTTVDDMVEVVAAAAGR